MGTYNSAVKAEEGDGSREEEVNGGDGGGTSVILSAIKIIF